MPIQGPIPPILPEEPESTGDSSSFESSSNYEDYSKWSFLEFQAKYLNPLDDYIEERFHEKSHQFSERALEELRRVEEAYENRNPQSDEYIPDPATFLEGIIEMSNIARLVDSGMIDVDLDEDSIVPDAKFVEKVWEMFRTLLAETATEKIVVKVEVNGKTIYIHPLVLFNHMYKKVLYYKPKDGHIFSDEA